MTDVEMRKVITGIIDDYGELNPETRKEMICYLNELFHDYDMYCNNSYETKIIKFTANDIPLKYIQEDKIEEGLLSYIEDYLDDNYDPDSYSYDVQYLTSGTDVIGAILTVTYHG